jgi:hypothetical protein
MPVIFTRPFAAKRPHGFRRACDRHAKRIIRKEFTVENILYQFFGSVFVHFHLFDDHTLLVLEIRFVKARCGQHIRDQVKRLRELIVRHLDNKTRLVMRRKCVEVAT